MTEEKQNSFFNFSDSDICLTQDDLFRVIEKKGLGFIYNSEVFNINDFEKLIIKKFEKYLTSSKIVLIKFVINQHEPLSNIQKCMDVLYDKVDDEIEVIFGVKSVECPKIGTCEVGLMFSGVDSKAINLI